MKKILFFLPVLCIPFLASCSSSPSTLTFAHDEYDIYSGDSVTVIEHNADVNYTFIGEVPSGVTLDSSSGVITFGDDLLNASQVLYQAYNDNFSSDMVVLTLYHEQKEGNLSFLNLTDKIIDGDYILANNSEGHAIRYRLKEDVYGVTIDESSGRVTFAGSCRHNEQFTVVISSKNSLDVEKTFYTVTEGLIKSLNDTQACEENGDSSISYFLDENTIKGEVNILGVLHGKNILKPEEYLFDAETNQLLIKPEFLNTLQFGESTLSIVTSNNNINVNVIKANKFIRTAKDLASIGESVEALNGYYILANDIDLTSYLSVNGEGYNDNKGWNPIGTYTETTDGTATAKAFNGTFDGNGYTISGLKIDRSDELAYNAGLFGYVDNLSLIKNLTLVTDSTLNIRSYSGVLTGNNQGKIMNCYVKGNIANYSGENLFKNLGIIAGTNGGEIIDCIAEGSVNSDAYGGTLVGSNEGSIIGCYSIAEDECEPIGVGNATIDSYHFTSKGDFLEHDFDGELDEKYWEITANGPKTKQYLEYFSLYSIEIENPNKESYTKGEKFDIDVQIYPTSLHEQCINDVEYTIVGEGIIIDGSSVDTSAATCNEFSVTVSLTAQGKTFVQTRDYILYDKITEIVVSDTVETIMNAGYSYRLKAEVYPFTANQNVTWKLSSSYKGISISKDVVSIDEDCLVNSFSLFAYSGTIKSKKYTITVNQFKTLENGSIVMYKSDLKDLEFTFSEDVDLTGVNAYIDHALIAIKEVKDHSVIISSSYLELIPDKTLKFKFITSDGSMYRGYATYFSREIYDLDYVSNTHEEYHTIGSVNDFAKYFNVLGTTEEEIKYSEAKHEYYDDIFVLTNDIDFENNKMFGIGTYDSDAGTGVKFTGTIYGQGYSFKNINIQDNEKWFINDDKTGNYRNSLYAVGFFGTFDGKIYDVTFDNVNVSANNWVAGFACTIGENGYLENIAFVNSSVKSTGGTQGKIYCTNQGAANLVVVSFNGALSNLGR